MWRLILMLLACSNGFLSSPAAVIPAPAPITFASGEPVPANYRLPIVFVYTVVPAVCHKGLPDYIKTSLEQALQMNPDCDVIIVSNFAECEKVAATVDGVSNLIKIDSTLIRSTRTKQFQNVSSHVFASDGSNELWATSALRLVMNAVRWESAAIVTFKEAYTGETGFLYQLISTEQLAVAKHEL
jgi:hypothetical protein